MTEMMNHLKPALKQQYSIVWYNRLAAQIKHTWSINLPLQWIINDSKSMLTNLTGLLQTAGMRWNPRNHQIRFPFAQRGLANG